MYKFKDVVVNVSGIKYMKLIEKGWSSTMCNGAYMPSVKIVFLDGEELRIKIEDSDIGEYRKFEKYVLGNVYV